MTGKPNLQISDLNPSLCALVKQIGHDQHAITHLATFLGGLDEVEVQKYLLARKGS
jgi:hypothetical protein